MKNAMQYVSATALALKGACLMCCAAAVDGPTGWQTRRICRKETQWNRISKQRTACRTQQTVLAGIQLPSTTQALRKNICRRCQPGLAGWLAVAKRTWQSTQTRYTLQQQELERATTQQPWAPIHEGQYLAVRSKLLFTRHSMQAAAGETIDVTLQSSIMQC
jgi:hypothetical protein